MCRIELFVFVGFSLVNVRRPELRPFWMLPWYYYLKFQI
jgi:hypothetical protein